MDSAPSRFRVGLDALDCVRHHHEHALRFRRTGSAGKVAIIRGIGSRRHRCISHHARGFGAARAQRHPFMKQHPRHQLDDAFLTPIRLSLMAALGPRNEIDFATLKQLLEVEDSALSKAISYFADAGYAKVIKGTVGNRARTWVTSTASGYRAYQQHLLALQAIIDQG